MMDGRGRHVATGSSAFIRDLVVMAVGIVIVGVLLYGGLSLFAGLGSDDDPAAAGVTTSSTETTVRTQPSSTVSSVSTVSTTTTSAPEEETTTTVVEVRPPSEVTVVVLNSTGTSGIAGALTTSLSEAGYQTLQADNFAPTLDQSAVWYLGDFAPEAAEVQAEFVSDATIAPYEGPDLGADVIVVLGASYGG
jgi:hypothetical protein